MRGKARQHQGLGSEPQGRLQNRLPRFNSGRGLQAFSLSRLPEGIHPLLHEVTFKAGSALL